MKIKLLVPRVGSDGVFNRGDEIDVPDDEAQRMVDDGQCLILPVVETTMAKVAKVEKAV